MLCMSLIRISFVVLSALVASGCGTSFRENHYFSSASDDPTRERKTNYFRVTVDGWVAFSAARYVSGYYDERAVDLFFNEVKTIDGTPVIAPLFQEPFADDQIRPLSPDQAGALVLILSTNADAVADAIGSFAEGEAAAAAISNLVNQDEIRTQRRTEAERAARERGATALATEVGTFMTAMAPAQEASFLRDYLRVANTLGRALDPPVMFASLEQVAVWHRRRTR